MTKKTIPDVFVEGARKGWGIWTTSTLPNVLMAFVIIQMLTLSGLLGLIGRLFGPIMAIFGLPGEAFAVLVSAWMSMGGGTGAAAALYTAGSLTGVQVGILLPAIYLMGSQIQFMGRCLGTAEVNTRYYGLMFIVSIVNAFLSMFVMRILIAIFGA
jgi:spore maturation protein SpmB